jgi:outer membrane immunogenic protein
MKNFALVALALGTSTPAFAQVAYQVNGPRIEGRIGWDNTALDLHASDGTESFNQSESKSGITYGGELGYDVSWSSATLGVYAGVEDSSTKECLAIYGDDEGCLKAGRNITVGARVGYPVGPASLAYIKGGYSNGRASVTYEDFADASYNVSEHDNLDGFHVGAGVELGVTSNTYAKLEYVYTDYNGYEISDGTNMLSLDAHRHQVVAGFGFRF